MDREGFATDDLKTGNQYQITNDISEAEFDKIYRYDTLCYIACDVNILQTYKKTYEYRGKNYITIKDAIAMIEACLEDTETENVLKIPKNINDYLKMLKKILSTKMI